MTNMRDTLEKELSEIKKLGKELQSQAKRSQRELRETFKDLEKRWPELEKRIEEFEQTSADAVKGMATNLGEELSKAYRQLRQALASEEDSTKDK